MEQPTWSDAQPGASWRWWPEVLIRGAGFPADGVLRLADPDLSRHADTLYGREPDESEWRWFADAYAASVQSGSDELRHIAADPAFRAAVAWQNHRLIDGALNPFLRLAEGRQRRNSKTRQREELVATYWQRYCVKNDSIGFFGPVGWGRLTDAPSTAVAPGAQLVRQAEVFFETWAIDRLADVLGAEPGMREWLMPRRLPFIRLDGTAVRPPVGSAVTLQQTEAAILRWCDGATRVREMSGPAWDQFGIGLSDVLQTLELFEKRRWIAWKLDVALSPWPERDLREFLGGIGDESLRSAALSRLDRLEHARAGLQPIAVAGPDADADDLSQRLIALDALFTDLTGASSTRNEGQTYGGRTLVYADSQRDLTIRIGQDLRAAAAPIDLLAHSARWFCWQLAEVLRAQLSDVYRRTVTSRGTPLDLATLWFAALRPLHATAAEAVGAIRADFTDRWARILRIGDGAEPVVHSYDELLPYGLAAFDAPTVGWAGARYFSPDLMVAARDVDAIRAGDFTLVLGEIHMAINTQRSYCFVTQHPEPNRLADCIDRDFPNPRILPVLPKHAPPRLSIRTHPAFARDRDYMLEFNHHSVRGDRPGLVLSCDVSVIERDGDLLVQLPNGEEFDLLDTFAEFLMDTVIDQFQLLPDRPYTPRVTVDRVVLVRESWRFQAGQPPFPAERDEARRFVLAREWHRSAGMPRHVFVKPPSGEKPVYVDFDSPVYVNCLAKVLRRAAAAGDGATVAVVEMLPSLDQLWLSDRLDRRYTSELRFAAVDRLNCGLGMNGRSMSLLILICSTQEKKKRHE